MGDKDPSNIKSLQEIKETFYVEKHCGDKDDSLWIRPSEMEISIKWDTVNGN